MIAVRKNRRSALLHLTCLTVLCQSTAAINSVLDLKAVFPYLINKTNGEVIEPRDYMNFDNIYTPNDTYKRQITAQGRNYFMFKAFDFANYFQSDYWHYSSEQDLILSAFPVANKNRCEQQLQWLESHLNKPEVLFGAGEQHVNLMTLVDAFGRPEASTFAGHNYWLGDFNQCNRVVIDMDKFEQEECRRLGDCTLNSTSPSSTAPTVQNKLLKTRYCIGKAHDSDWPNNDDYTPRISYKIGLCLPETCETLSFERHADILERLMRFNMPQYMKNRMNLHEIYCLPDSRSPIRQLSRSSRIFLGVCVAWLSLLVASTWLFACQKRHQHDLQLMAEHVKREEIRMADRQAKQLHVGINSKLNLQTMICTATNGDSARHKTEPDFDSLSAIKIQQEEEEDEHSLDSSHLSRSSRFSAWLNESPAFTRVMQTLSISENMKEFHKPPGMLAQQVSTRKLPINLNALDAIKCFCCILVIFGHIVFVHMQHLTNIVHTIELSNQIPPRLLMAFFNFVDTFFIISGMLTAYFVFKRFTKHTFANPLIWLLMTALRFIRLSSVYVLVFWFSKTLTVHLSEGPIWDYGTDKNSNKGLCINDHWWKSILYLGNYGTMQPLCVLPAWSIIVDSQYSLIMAPILFLIFRYKRVAYAGLLAAVLAATTSMSHQLATQTATKTSDMAKVRLHVYPLISRFAAEFYNTATNRVGPVAIGILGGHCLYLYEMGRIKRWPRFMRGTGFKVVLLLHLLVLLMPTIGLLTDNPMSTQETDITIFVICNAAIKPLWSIVNTILLLRLVTDLRKRSAIARLMSHNIWHCLGKLCFASYLIHYEIIMVVMKSRHDGYPQPNWMNMAREFSIVFMISTILAYFIYIMFEAPINKLVVVQLAKPGADSDSAGKKLDSTEMMKSADKATGASRLDAGQQQQQRVSDRLGCNQNSSRQINGFRTKGDARFDDVSL